MLRQTLGLWIGMAGMSFASDLPPQPARDVQSNRLTLASHGTAYDVTGEGLQCPLFGASALRSTIAQLSGVQRPTSHGQYCQRSNHDLPHSHMIWTGNAKEARE